MGALRLLGALTNLTGALPASPEEPEASGGGGGGADLESSAFLSETPSFHEAAIARCASLERNAPVLAETRRRTAELESFHKTDIKSQHNIWNRFVIFSVLCFVLISFCAPGCVSICFWSRFFSVSFFLTATEALFFSSSA